MVAGKAFIVVAGGCTGGERGEWRGRMPGIFLRRTCQKTNESMPIFFLIVSVFDGGVAAKHAG